MPVQHRAIRRAVALLECPVDSARPQTPKGGRCKSDPRTKNIPVVVLTSSMEERDLIDSYNLGVNSYVVKPVDFRQFTEAIRQLVLYWMSMNQLPSEMFGKGKQAIDSK